MNKSIKMINGLEKSPSKFIIPTDLEKDYLRIGDFVKIGLELVNPPEEGPVDESLWFKLTEMASDGSLVGVLDNNPSVVKEYIKLGDTLDFHIDNVLEILK